MRYAYHWNDEASGLLEMEERWFRVALGLTSPLRNLVIRTGNISIGSFPEPGASRLDALAEAVGEPLGLWSSFTADGYQELLVRYSTLAIVASGLTREEGVGIHRSIRRDVPAYVGAVEVDNRQRRPSTRIAG